ncbi:MAG: FAD-dependent oxidoreductase [Gammaproteobacteria bacterium]|nr:FAD-dependent oxidoreductase [Gammaproteobacteria bacterium]MDJ0893389.1 FAD-dependent oxidoreductase [Gammaproteobacteria bacterium]
MQAIIDRKRKSIAVVGCGFAGISLVRRLARRVDSGTELVAFDPSPDLYNYTILPRTLVEPVPGHQVTVPLAKIFRHLPVRLLEERVEGVDTARNTLHTCKTEMRYDCLVLATGSRARPLDCDPVSTVIYPKAFRHLIRLREQVSRVDGTVADEPGRDWSGHGSLIAVVGGGLTGIEFAVAIRQALNHKNSRQQRLGRLQRVEIFERSDRLAPALPAQLSHHLQAVLEADGIKVHLNARVQRVNRQRLVLHDRSVAAEVVICCIGSSPNLRLALQGLDNTDSGVQVNACLQAKANDRVLAAGDCADLSSLASGMDTKYASHAIRQGKLAADNAWRLLRGTPVRPYTGRAPPVGVMLGNGRACFALSGLHYTGRLAGLMKRYLERRCP